MFKPKLNVERLLTQHLQRNESCRIRAIEQPRQRLPILPKTWETRVAGLLYMSEQPWSFSHVSLSAFPRLLRLRIRRDVHCTNKTYFEPRVEISHRKKVTKSQTWRF